MDNYCHKAIQWRKTGLFNQQCQNNWIFISKAKDFNSYLTLHIKLNSKWTIDLNIRTKTIRCLEENTRKNLFDFTSGKDFFRHGNKAQFIKEKNYKLNLIKMKNFSILKDSVKRTNREATDWHKIFANNI